MVLLGILLLFLIIYFSGIEATIQAILNSNPSFILLALVFFAVETFFKSFRWKMFLESIGSKIPFSHAFYSFNSAMFLGNVVPFKAVEPIRGAFLKLKFKVSFSKTISLVLTERAIDVFFYIALSLITLYALREFLPSYITFFSFVGMFLFFSISLAVLLILNNKKLTLKFFKFLSKFPVINKFEKRVEKIAKNFSQGFEQLKKSKNVFPIFVLTLLIWLCECGIFLSSAKAVGVNLSILFFAIPLLSILLGVLTLIPGGLGSIEAIIILILTSLGFPAPQATAASLIYRFITHLMENSIGAIVIPQVYGVDIVKKLMKRMT